MTTGIIGTSEFLFGIINPPPRPPENYDLVMEEGHFVMAKDKDGELFFLKSDGSLQPQAK